MLKSDSKTVQKLIYNHTATYPRAYIDTWIWLLWWEEEKT